MLDEKREKEGNKYNLKVKNNLSEKFSNRKEGILLIPRKKATNQLPRMRSILLSFVIFFFTDGPKDFDHL